MKEMKYQRLRLAAAMLLGIAMIPAKAWPQSQAPSDETQALRKLVQQMQTQMGKMQAEIDQLKGTKPESAQAPPAAAPQSQKMAASNLCRLSVRLLPPNRLAVRRPNARCSLKMRRQLLAGITCRLTPSTMDFSDCREQRLR